MKQLRRCLRVLGCFSFPEQQAAHEYSFNQEGGGENQRKEKEKKEKEKDPAATALLQNIQRTILTPDNK